METLSCLKKKEVINVCDGMRLGFISDLEIDLRNGKICKIVVTEGNKCWNFFCNDREYRVPWECIKRIGDDIILVEVILEEVLYCGD